jgi:hypothetical protein
LSKNKFEYCFTEVARATAVPTPTNRPTTSTGREDLVIENGDDDEDNEEENEENNFNRGKSILEVEWSSL